MGQFGGPVNSRPDHQWRICPGGCVFRMQRPGFPPNLGQTPSDAAVMTLAQRPLRIAFYAPLKAPSHPVPSGDRLMAQLLQRALQRAGHRVELVSELRAYLGDPQDQAGWADLQVRAMAERRRIAALWAAEGAPDLWFCYHPYYKAPDLLGPDLARQHGLAYVTAESSLSARRNIGIWAQMQARVAEAVAGARLNLCLTARDAEGLRQHLPGAALARLAPFIAPEGFAAPPAPQPGHLVTVAMMRPGDKAESYRRLASLLALLPKAIDWHLSVAGDGPLRAEVQAMFQGLPVRFLGQLAPDAIAALLARGSVYLWPGCGEAYGLAYLEAQAAGLPVVAQAVAGVPEVVTDGQTGFLTPEGDDAAAAAAVTRLLTDAALRQRLGQAARDRVARRHTLDAAAQALDHLLRPLMEKPR